MPKIKALDVVCAVSMGASAYFLSAAPLSGVGSDYVVHIAAGAFCFIVGACAFVKTACDRF